MALDDDIAVFEQVPLLAHLGEEALRILAIGAESHRIQHGAVLFYAGDLADGGFVVQQGSFLLEPDTPRQGESVTVGPGALLGELALLTDTVHTVTATAVSAASVIRIPRSLFLKMLEGYPAAALQMRDAMAQRIDAFTRDMTALKPAFDPDRNA
ncbi:MAG: Crp/Fnr family transcriptional regulator [Pseudolabrys sp.]|nr:Crp/Fnr family transcriptional regulator [Pseudolabrys sp.]